MAGLEQTKPRTLFDELTLEELEDVNATPDQPRSLSSTGFPQAARSAKGFTLDTTLIVNGVSQTVRSLWDQGLLTVVTTTAVEGTGLAAQTVTLYEAEFNDRPRSFVITEETYRALNNATEPYNEVPSEAQQRLINTSVKPLPQDRLSSRENPNDARGNPKRYSDDTRFPAVDAVDNG